jgi:hypothetical protein
MSRLQLACRSPTAFIASSRVLENLASNSAEWKFLISSTSSTYWRNLKRGKAECKSFFDNGLADIKSTRPHFILFKQPRRFLANLTVLSYPWPWELSKYSKKTFIASLKIPTSEAKRSALSKKFSIKAKLRSKTTDSLFTRIALVSC